MGVFKGNLLGVRHGQAQSHAQRDLSTDSMIHLLISGINSKSLRETAAALPYTSVDEFFDSMHQIASISAEPDRKHPADQKERTKETSTKTTGRVPTAAKQPKSDLICNYCKKMGHTTADCYKLKKKE